MGKVGSFTTQWAQHSRYSEALKTMQHPMDYQKKVQAYFPEAECVFEEVPRPQSYKFEEVWCVCSAKRMLGIGDLGYGKSLEEAWKNAHDRLLESYKVTKDELLTALKENPAAFKEILDKMKREHAVGKLVLVAFSHNSHWHLLENQIDGDWLASSILK